MGYEVRIKAYPFTNGCPAVFAVFVKEPIISLNSLHLGTNHSTAYVQISFRTVFRRPVLGCVSVLLLISRCLEFLISSFFLKAALAILGPLNFYEHLRISLSMSTIKAC